MTSDEFINYQTFAGCTVIYKDESFRIIEKDVEEGLFCILYCGADKWVRYENVKQGSPLHIRPVTPQKKQRSSKKGKPWSFYK
jgi:hypothetical protein